MHKMMKKKLRALCRRYLFTQNTIRYQVEWARLEAAFKRLPQSDLLFDGGAGSGEFLRLALASGVTKKVVALEYDPQNYQRLEENLGNDPRARLIRGSLLDVPLADASADVVMTTQVLEHIVDHEKAASELIRVLKPGGYALVSVPHPPEPFPNEGHVREGYLEKDLVDLFGALGCELLHTDYFLTRSTIHRILAAEKLPFKGMFIPVGLINAEAGMSDEQRRADTPFGILCLFRKNV